MTQDEKWIMRYNEVKGFIETNKRNPSKYDAEERGEYYTWLKHNRKQIETVTARLAETCSKYETVLKANNGDAALYEQYKHKNQWV